MNIPTRENRGEFINSVLTRVGPITSRGLDLHFRWGRLAKEMGYRNWSAALTKANQAGSICSYTTRKTGVTYYFSRPVK